jgi:hypothetical protein
MGILYEGLIDAAMRRYNVPQWLRPYIYKYAKKSNVDTIKQAIGFINVRRRKGELTKKHVILPNGTKFEIDAVVHILNQFYYGISKTGEIAKAWSTDASTALVPELASHFREIAAARQKHAKALRNMMDGLGGKIYEPTTEIKEVFDKVKLIDEPIKRALALDIIIRDAYSRPFGFIFYKVFYPVSPEFMRSLGKVFSIKSSSDAWIEEFISDRLRNGQITAEDIMELSRELLKLIYVSIDSEIHLAKKAGIEPEANLLRDISIAYPLHTLQGMGVGIDINYEMKKIVNDR